VTATSAAGWVWPSWTKVTVLKRYDISTDVPS
jgi:hypothetical protein